MAAMRTSRCSVVSDGSGPHKTHTSTSEISWNVSKRCGTWVDRARRRASTNVRRQPVTDGRTEVRRHRRQSEWVTGLHHSRCQVTDADQMIGIFVTFRSLHFLRYISFVTFPSLHFLRYISFVTFPSLHFVRYISFVTFPSLPFLRYISFVTFPSLHFLRYISFVTFLSLHFLSYISFVTFPSLHFLLYISFVTFP